MTQTTKRRMTIFPFLQPDAPPTRATSLEMIAAPATLDAGREQRGTAAVITARGQRFSLRQIGSMFGSE